jgi:hypothetical protein
MTTSRGRYCGRCRNRISRKMRLCPVCGAVNFKPVDYLVLALLLAAGAYAAWRWL